MDSLLRALYVITTIFGAGVILVDMLGLLGHGGDDGDGQEATHGSGAPLLSFLRYLRILVYFCAGFGPFGLAARAFGSGTLSSVVWALPGGIGVAFLARAFFRFQQTDVDSTLSDDELLAHCREAGSSGYHPMGSCRMGPAADPGAVVDEELRVHGVQCLRVVDTSVMPTMPSANLNASTLMIAEKAADMILGRAPLPAKEL